MLRFNALAAVLFLAFGCMAGPVTVGELRCEHLQNPLGVDVWPPRLSWTLSAPERNVEQKAC